MHTFILVFIVIAILFAAWAAISAKAAAELTNYVCAAANMTHRVPNITIAEQAMSDAYFDQIKILPASAKRKLSRVVLNQLHQAINSTI